MTPGEWLRAQRHAAGLSQARAADRSRTAQATWSQFERDRFPHRWVGVPLDLMSLAVGARPTELRERLSAWTQPAKEVA